MHSPGINGEELRGQLANPGSPVKMAVKMECVCVYVCVGPAKNSAAANSDARTARHDELDRYITFMSFIYKTELCVVEVQTA